MVQNFPGPYIIKMNYTSLGQQHKHQMNVVLDGAPVAGEDMSNIFGVTRDGTLIDMTVVITSWISKLAPFYTNAETVFGDVELWKITITGSTFVESFVTSYSHGVTPSGSGSNQRAQQSTFTFRSAEGGIAKVVLLETTTDSDAKTPIAGGSANVVALGDYLIDPSLSPFVAKDTSYMIATLNVAYGENERLWRKRYRS